MNSQTIKKFQYGCKNKDCLLILVLEHWVCITVVFSIYILGKFSKDNQLLINLMGTQSHLEMHQP